MSFRTKTKPVGQKSRTPSFSGSHSFSFFRAKTNRAIAAPLPAAPGPLRLGLVEPAGPVTSAIVCASRPVDLAGRSLPASPSTSGTTTGTGFGLNEAAELRHPRLSQATTAKVPALTRTASHDS